MDDDEYTTRCPCQENPCRCGCLCDRTYVTHPAWLRRDDDDEVVSLSIVPE